MVEFSKLDYRRSSTLSHLFVCRLSMGGKLFHLAFKIEALRKTVWNVSRIAPPTPDHKRRRYGTRRSLQSAAGYHQSMGDLPRRTDEVDPIFRAEIGVHFSSNSLSQIA